jgi:lactoylglutathione lyase
MADIGLSHIALPVRSLGASIAFYKKYADMQIVHSRPGVAWLSDLTRVFAIVLIETTTEVKPLLPIAHLGVGLKSEGDVDRLSRLAAQEGRLVKAPEQSGPPIGYWALLCDPDGHTLELAHGQELEAHVRA